MPKTPFDYNKAFSRNIGWITPEEQQILRYKKVAIAGLGGVGGNHLITLTRLGVGKFNISDFDTYDIANFNRQIGASMSTIGQPKLDILKEQACAINPEIEINSFPTGINEGNVDDFLEGVDLYVDSLDFFVLDVRRLIFAKCAEKEIPAITAAPLGMGCAFLAFLPGQMSFEEYFQLEGHDETEQLIRFLVGLAPRALQNKYLVYPQAIDLKNHKGPSTPMAIELCAGLAASEALKIMLRRGKVNAAPWSLHFDAYRNKLVKNWRPWGNDNPIQKLALTIGRKKFGEAYKAVVQEEAQPQSTIEKILDLAKWAPSGDNAQPWRFEILDENSLVVHGFDTRDHVIYDLQGHASQLATGCLLENIEIAATNFHWSTTISQEHNQPEGQYRFHVGFNEDNNLTPNPLAPYIPLRTVQRRPMSPKRLSNKQKELLEECLPEGYKMIWFEGQKQKWQITKLIFNNAGLRLTLPEAFETHKQAIEWNSKFSDDKLPDQSLGVDTLTLKIMHWSMQNWQRVNFMNRFMGGTLLPRIQMELIPGLCCGAHFILMAPSGSTDDYVGKGRAVQRFWLNATSLGLQIQPQYTPIVFHEYNRDRVTFSESPESRGKASRISQALMRVTEKYTATHHPAFMGRIGQGQAAFSRSVRLPLSDLISNSG